MPDTRSDPYQVESALVLLFVYKSRVFGSTFRYFKSLWLVGIANVGIYLLVVIDGRYLAGYLPLLAILSLAAVRVRNSPRNVGTAHVASVVLQCGPRLARATAVLVRTHGDIRDERWLVAEEFQELGVQAGTPVAAIDFQRGYQYWPPALISDWAAWHGSMS